MNFLDKIKEDNSNKNRFSATEVGNKGHNAKSFVDMIKTREGRQIYKIVGKDAINGLDAVYFLLVDKNRIEAFKIGISTDDVNLLDYGRIAASCYGKEANRKVKSIMKEKYGLEL